VGVVGETRKKGKEDVVAVGEGRRRISYLASWFWLMISFTTTLHGLS
jgi:hypothetical protein